jgi:hypothetical protein
MYRTDEYGFLFSDPLCKKGWNREEEPVLPSGEGCCFGGLRMLSLRHFTHSQGGREC